MGRERWAEAGTVQTLAILAERLCAILPHYSDLWIPNGRGRKGKHGLLLEYARPHAAGPEKIMVKRATAARRGARLRPKRASRSRKKRVRKRGTSHSRSASAGLDIKPEAVCSRIERFIQKETRAAGRSRVVVGLSGGIDSALSAALARRALGRAGVIAILMPYRNSRKDSLRDAEELAKYLDIRYETVDISPMVDAFFDNRPEADRLRRGNKMARERMSILFDCAAARDALVLGTSNRTETLLGYGTHFGDTACSLNPIGCLYKTQVRLLALHVAVPERIRTKIPTADLWPDQTDEAELGYTYEEIDRLLLLMVDRGLKLRELQAHGFDREMVRSVQDRIQRNEFKRRMPYVAPITTRH